jgi:hypothetical protein
MIHVLPINHLELIITTMDTTYVLFCLGVNIVMTWYTKEPLTTESLPEDITSSVKEILLFMWRIELCFIQVYSG